MTTLESDAGGPAIGMWKGADEPFWSGIAPERAPVRLLPRHRTRHCELVRRRAGSRLRSRLGDDSGAAWHRAQLAPYTPVTDIHGVDVYPVTLAASAPNLHDVGSWTSTIASVTPSRAVWTTLQVCASGSYDSSGRFVLPTFAQERYMLYDAILNGARSIAFYGGNNPNCWTASDSQFGWNWSFWNSVLKPLLGEINSLSPLAPALVNPATTQTLHGERCDDPGDQPARQFRGSLGDCSPPWPGHGTRDDRRRFPQQSRPARSTPRGGPIAVSNGSFTDDFAQWGVHVYHFVPDAPPPPPPPPAALLRRRGRGLGSRHVLGRSRGERQGWRPSRPRRSPWRTGAVSRRVSSPRFRRPRTSRSRDRLPIVAPAALPVLPSPATSTSSGHPARFVLLSRSPAPGLW